MDALRDCRTFKFDPCDNFCQPITLYYAFNHSAVCQLEY